MEDRFYTFHHNSEGLWREDEDRRGFNPRTHRELRVYRLASFEKQLLYSSEWIHLLHLRGKENPKDERLFALVEVPSARVQFDDRNRIQRMVALEGAFASVIGGAPAAAVVFPSQVFKETNLDPRVAQARKQLRSGRAYYQKDFDELYQKVYAEKQSALAQKFDSIHSVERARRVGSIDDIISLAELRPYLVRKVEEGMQRFSPSRKR